MRALYEKTIGFILQYIDENRLHDGARLPPEARLAVLAGVSLVTVRRALQELSSQAIVRREQGRGTFVARSRLRAGTARAGSLRTGLRLDARSRLSTQVLSCSARQADPGERKALGLQAGASVWELSRLRLLNRRPLILESALIPRLLAPDLGGHFRSRRDRGSLGELLEREYALKEASAEQQLCSRPAHAREQERLGLLNFEWVVEVSGVSYASRREPIECFRLVFAARSFAFRLAAAPACAVEAVELA